MCDGDGDERTADFFLVPFEDAEFFHGADVKDAHRLVTRGTREEVTVWRPSKRLDRVFVLMTVQRSLVRLYLEIRPIE